MQDRLARVWRPKPGKAPVRAGEATRTPDALRASDADRLEVGERLRDAAADGRLTIDELDDRLERAWTAKTRGDLRPLTADLPSPSITNPGPPLLVKTHLSSLRREGYWEPPAHIDVQAVMASVRLDLSQAKVSTSEIAIDVRGWCSDVQVVVPPGASVDFADLMTPLGSCEVRGTPATDDGVLVRVSGRMTMGSVKVRRLSATESFLRKTFGR